MAERFFELSAADRDEALGLGAAKSGRPAHLLEKDVWVVWVLSALFESPLGTTLTFKGGTSLSKVYRVIDRFSEDIDLTYDIRQLLPDIVKGDPPLPPSKSQAKKWTDAVRERLPEWIRERVEPVLHDALARDRLDAELTVGGDERDKLVVEYAPLRNGTGYVAPRVVLEFGARSTGEPQELHTVTCDIATHLPSVLFPEARPRVMKLTRTFWEKATAAHVYCQQARLRGERFSRHWFDLAAIFRSPHFTEAIVDGAVAIAVADHKSWFFVEKNAAGEEVDYRSAVGGGLQIVPTDAAKDMLQKDYAKMLEDGLLADARAFEDVLAACAELEARINKAMRSLGAVELPATPLIEPSATTVPESEAP